MLPVVFGGANYTRFAPPNSYINARDYASIRELTEYLLYLDQNPEEHIQYFIWHERYKIRPNEYELQDICEYLKNADIVQIKANTLKTTNTKTVSWLNENMCRPYELPETWTSWAPVSSCKGSMQMKNSQLQQSITETVLYTYILHKCS